MADDDSEAVVQNPDFLDSQANRRYGNNQTSNHKVSNFSEGSTVHHKVQIGLDGPPTPGSMSVATAAAAMTPQAEKILSGTGSSMTQQKSINKRIEK